MKKQQYDILTTPSIAVVGPMRSGKSATLLKWIHAYNKAGLTVLAIKPEIDTRDGEKIVSREKNLPINNFPAYTVQNTRQIVSIFEKMKEQDNKPDVVIIDEAMLLDEGLIMIRDYVTIQKSMIRIAGLDRDFRGEFFDLTLNHSPYDDDGIKRMTSHMGDVLSDYQAIVFQTGSCATEDCQMPATLTQKLVDGKPAAWKDPVVEVGDSQYEPRCTVHHAVKNKPNPKEKMPREKAQELVPKAYDKWSEKPDKSKHEYRRKSQHKR